MKKIIIFLFVTVLLFTACSKQVSDEVTDSEKNVLTANNSTTVDKTSENTSASQLPEDTDFLDTSEEATSETPQYTAYFTDRNIETTMLPSSANLVGVCSGYVFVPIGDAVYRYTSYSTDISGVTQDELLLECMEYCDFDNDLKWRFYTLKEYPGCEIILGVGGYDGSTLFKYEPAIAVSENAVTDAIKAGFVVMKNGSVIEGKDKWLEFYNRVQSGEAASVYLGYTYSNENYNMTDELREATEEDYPSMFLKKLSYDGNVFTIESIHLDDGKFVVRHVDGYDEPTVSYKYLRHFQDKAKYDFSLFSAYDKYVLTDNDTAGWDDLEYGMISSNWDDYIEFIEVYCEYTWK